MKNWWKYTIAIILGSILCYQLAIHLTPNVIYAGAKKKIMARNGAEINELRTSPVITAEMRSVVMPNPDFLYLTAHYDLSDGPLRLHGNMPDSTYWSVSMYHPNTVNWYVKNDMEYGSSELDLPIYLKGDVLKAKAPVAVSDKATGFLLMRVLITDRTDENVRELKELLDGVRLERI